MCTSPITNTTVDTDYNLEVEQYCQCGTHNQAAAVKLVYGVQHMVA